MARTSFRETEAARRERHKARKRGRIEAREAAGLTQAQAAKIAGLRLSSFQLYERTGRFHFCRAEILAHAYGCRLEVFL